MDCKEGKGYPLQYSGLENPRDGRAWWAAVCGVAQSRTRLSDLAAAAAEARTSYLGLSRLDPDQVLSLRCHPRHLHAKDVDLRPQGSWSWAQATPNMLTQPTTLNQNKPREGCPEISPAPKPQGLTQIRDLGVSSPMDRAIFGSPPP